MLKMGTRAHDIIGKPCILLTGRAFPARDVVPAVLRPEFPRVETDIVRDPHETVSRGTGLVSANLLADRKPALCQACAKGWG